MRKVLGALLVVGLLVGGGVAYALLSSPPSATAQDDDSSTAEPDAALTDDTAATDSAATDDAATDRRVRRDVLGEVLDQLVTDNVITQDQADQIRASFAAKREELRAEFGAQRGDGATDRRGFRGFGHTLDEFLADGVIDADELAQLPEGNPLTDPDGPAAQYLEDGEITQEELDLLIAELRADAPVRHHGPDTDDETTDTTTTTTG
jgi:hypothetical protein